MALLICLWGLWLHGIPFVNKTLLKNTVSEYLKRWGFTAQKPIKKT
jgi:hypothetical protein